MLLHVRRNRVMRAFRPAAAIACWAIAAAAVAQDIGGYPTAVQAYDPREVGLLPRYCIHTQSFRDLVPGGNDAAAIRGWYDQLGPTYHALHHYCWGLMKLNRALRLATDPQTRSFYLSDSITEFNYVIDRAPDDFVLLPEILTRKGEVLVRLGRGAVGLIELERAIALKRDYWPAYAAKADFHQSQGDTSKALETLRTGLSLAPGTAALERRIAELESKGTRRAGNASKPN